MINQRDLLDSINYHQKIAKSLILLTLGEPVRSYAKILSEAILTEVIPVLEHAYHCQKTLDSILTSATHIDPVLIHALEDVIGKAIPYTKESGNFVRGLNR